MEFIPVKTRIMKPPQDDLLAVLDEYLTDVQEGDVVAISSKVVAVHEGNCVPSSSIEKKELIRQSADLMIPRDYWHSPLTIVKNAFIGMSGVDASNAGDHYVKLPEDAFASAQNIHNYLRKRFSIEQVGVILTDSHSGPLRRGSTGISIGFWGFKPTINHIGEKDLFGREFKIEVVNLVDGLAAAANVAMGEAAECQPVVVMRDVPDLTFTTANLKDEVYMPFEEDTFRVLYERFIDKQ